MNCGEYPTAQETQNYLNLARNGLRARAEKGRLRAGDFEPEKSFRPSGGWHGESHPRARVGGGGLWVWRGGAGDGFPWQAGVRGGLDEVSEGADAGLSGKANPADAAAVGVELAGGVRVASGGVCGGGKWPLLAGV